MRTPARSMLAAVALTLLLGSCAPSVAPVRSGDSLPSGPSEQEPLASPSPVPSDLLHEEPPEGLAEALDDSDPPASGAGPSAPAWPEWTWPLVDVPPAPAPRLAITCDQLLTSSAASDTRVIAAPATVQAIGVRQAGGTVCAYGVELPTGQAELLLLMAGDLTSPIGAAPVECWSESPESQPARCSGHVTAGAGGASIGYSLPVAAEITAGVEQAQRLLGAAAVVLESDPQLRPVPAVDPDSMGAAADGCAPTAEQRELVFSLFDLGQYPDVYGGVPGVTHIDSELNGRSGAWQCWWWLGWQGVTVEVVPGGAWAVDSEGKEEVDVLGAVAAYRSERMVLEYRSTQEWLMPEITIVASARGSAVIVRAVVDESHAEYFNERLPVVAGAIIATQP